jgi:hypothetical protein
MIFNTKLKAREKKPTFKSERAPAEGERRQRESAGEGREGRRRERGLAAEGVRDERERLSWRRTYVQYELYLRFFPI